jgi:hypothetical protein
MRLYGSAVLVVLSIALPSPDGPHDAHANETASGSDGAQVVMADSAQGPVIPPQETSQSASRTHAEDAAVRGGASGTVFVVLGIIVSLVSAMAAVMSVLASARSAAAAERTAKAAFSYSLVPLTSEVTVSFRDAHGIPQGCASTIEFYNPGNQTVRIDCPTLKGEPQGTVKLGNMGNMEYELCLQARTISVSSPTINVFAKTTAKIQLKFVIDDRFEAIGHFDGMLCFLLHPTLDDGTKSIDIPCRFFVAK